MSVVNPLKCYKWPLFGVYIAPLNFSHFRKYLYDLQSFFIKFPFINVADFFFKKLSQK